MTSIPQIAAAMQHVLTQVADTAARATGFVQRTSKLTGALFVQTLVFGFWATPTATREQRAQTAAALGLTISQQGLDQRMTETAAACLYDVLTAAVATIVTADPVAIPLLTRFTGVYIQDSTRIGLPRTLAHLWQGSGNQHTSAGTSAQLKVSVRLDLATGAMTGPQTDHGVTSDRSTVLQDAPIPAGGLRIADLGYFDLDVLRTTGEQDGYWLTRFPSTTVVFDAHGQRLDLLLYLAAQTAPTVDLPIQLGARHHLACRLLAQRVPQEVADQRRRRVRAEAKRRGRQPNALLLALAAWTLLVTNVPIDLLTVTEALVLARSRWQIECLWKLWKSHSQIDQWRSAKGAAIVCELYAKVIAMILQHWLLLVGCWTYPNRSLVKAAASVRLHVLGLAMALGDGTRLAAVIVVIVACLAVGCRINKRKTSPHTYQLLLNAPDLVVG